MPTLEEYYLEHNTADVTFDVFIGATRLENVNQIQWDFGIAQVPTCTITVNEVPPGAVVFNAQVRVEVGFFGVNRRQFTGRIVHINPNDKQTVIECQGYSLWLDVNFHEVILTFDHVTSEDAITALLDASGVPSYNVNVPAWTIGTQELSPNPDEEQYVTLEFETYGEAILHIGEPDRCKWFETPTGTILVRNTQPIPSLTAWRTYASFQLDGLDETVPAGMSAGTRALLRTVSVSHQLRDVKNRCIVQGVTYTQVNSDGSESPIDIVQRAWAPSPYVLAFDGTQEYNDELFPHDLIDTVAKAQEVAGTIVAEKNRLNDLITVAVDGDPELQLAVTIEIIDRDYSRVDGKYFVEQYSTTLNVDAGSFQTTITARGGAASGGQVNVFPFALFTWTIEREVIGDREWAVGTFDASGSADSDGSIVSYAWSGTFSGTGKTLHFRADPGVVGDSFSETLTVTDDQGATDSITLEVNITQGTDHVFIPAIFVAGDNRASASPDGGITWHDQAIGGESVIMAAARPPDGSVFGVGWYGTASGKVYLTTDYCATAPTLVLDTGGASLIAHIWPDLLHADWVWVLTRDGRLYKSELDGIAGSFFLFEDLRSKFTLPGLIASRIATPKPDGIWIYGGTGTGCPLIAVDPTKNHNWNIASLGGDLTADIGCSGTGTAAGVYIQSRQDNRVARADAGATTYATLINIVGATYSKLRFYGGYFYRIEEANDDVGQLQRSADGNTWTNIGPAPFTGSGGDSWGCRDFDFGANGWLWTLYGINAALSSNDAASAAKVYRTQDPIGAATFELMTTDSETTFGSNLNRQTAIYCHPSNADIVAFHMDAASGNDRLTHTIDGTASVPTWTKLTTNQSPRMEDAVFMADGSIVTVTGANIVRATDYQTFATVQAMNNSTAPNVCRNAAGSAVFVKCGSGGAREELWRTLNGTTWVRIFTNTSGRGLTPSATEYFDGRDEVYIASTGSGTTDRLYRYANVSAVTVDAAVETDVSGNIDSLSGWGSDDIADGGIAFAPAITVGDATLRIAEAASRETGELAIIIESAAHTPAVYYTPTIGVPSAWRRALGTPAKSHGRWLTPEFGEDGAGKFQFGFNDNVVYLGQVTDGVMAVTTAASALDSGDVANHGLAIGQFIGGVFGAHIVSGEGTIDGTLYKTWDRFTSIGKLRPATGFTAPPAGWNAKYCAVSAAGAVQQNAARLAIVADFGGATSFDIGYPVSPDILNDGWTDVDLPAQIDHQRPRPFCLDPLVWFVADVGGFSNPRSKSALSQCNSAPVRTPDGGTTWVSVPIGDETCAGGDEIGGLVRFDRAANGTYWALRGLGTTNAHPIRAEAFRSTQQGAPGTWDSMGVLVDPGSDNEDCWMIICHPSNPNIVVKLGWLSSGSNRGMVTYLTLNANDAVPGWVRHEWVTGTGTGTFTNSGNAMSSYAIMLPSGRLIVTTTPLFNISDPKHIWTSDDYGVTWTRRTIAAETSIDNVVIRFNKWGWRNGGNTVVGLRHPIQSGVAADFALVYSLDGGTTWIVDSTLDQPGSFTDTNNKDSLYDAVDDTMYFIVNPPGVGPYTTSRVWRCVGIMAGNRTWEDVSGNLSSGGINWECASLIPRA